MASSASARELTLYGTTAAPPPTPSAQPNDHFSSTSSEAAADALSRLLLRLPPSLSLPTRLSPPNTATKAVSPPLTLSLSGKNPDSLNTHISSLSQLGFFQLTGHEIPSVLAQSAELESLSLFNLPRKDKQQLFRKAWPLGFDDGEDETGVGESFCLDESCFAEPTQLLKSLRELTLELEKLGLQIVDSLSDSMGFENRASSSSLMWVSCPGVAAGNKPVLSGRFYPCIVALQYQIRRREYSLLADSGWVSVSPEVDSLLVTIGDIAQVWSNGRLKKVWGKRAEGNAGEGGVTMSLLITLPTDSTVSVAPLLPAVTSHGSDEDDNMDRDDGSSSSSWVFNMFSFDDYAWRVYHERFSFIKDPLDRYRST